MTTFGWGRDETCVQAWDAVLQFTKVMGLELNLEKTGSAHVSRKHPAAVSNSASLPQGSIHWGLLLLDSKIGHFVIDQDRVEKHIDELQRQLGTCKSVFAWIQAWNMYAVRFFLTNFGRAANCLGRQHVDMVLDEFERIQLRVFSTRSLAAVTSLLFSRR